jgi:hypothetical protein
MDTVLVRRSDRSQCSVCHRFARRKRQRIDVSRLVLWPGFCFQRLFHYGQRRVPQIFDRMEKRSLARAPESVLAEATVQKDPVIIVYGAGLENGRGHQH